jgi:hypothetical protein
MTMLASAMASHTVIDDREVHPPPPSSPSPSHSPSLPFALLHYFLFITCLFPLLSPFFLTSYSPPVSSPYTRSLHDSRRCWLRCVGEHGLDVLPFIGELGPTVLIFRAARVLTVLPFLDELDC